MKVGNNMDEDKQAVSKSLIISIMLVIIVIIVAIIVIIGTSNDSNPLEDETIKEMEKEKKQKEAEKEKIRRLDTFLDVISNLKYIDEKDYYKNNVMTISKQDDSIDVYVPDTGKKIYSYEENSFEWFGTFGIFLEGDDSKIIDNEGNVLFVTDEPITFHPGSKIWEYQDGIYDNTGLIEDNAFVIDVYGNYILAEKNGNMVLENNKLKEIYSVKLSKDDHIVDGNLDTIFDEQYAYLVTENNDYIVNVKNGKEVYKADSGEINYLNNNIFEIEKDTYFVKNDKLAIKVKGNNHETEASNKYIAIDNDVYDVNTLQMVDTNTFIPDEETNKVEKLTGLELVQCRTGFGLKYKGEEVLECKYDAIDFFEYNITKSLMSSNKLYVVISEDDYSFEIYDVYNKKIVLYNIDSYDGYSPFVTLYQDDNIYVYNIIDASKSPNENGDNVFLYDNYYVLESNNVDTYYNKMFKKIISVEATD